MNDRVTTEVIVIGSGPGGYTAAFRAADLGKKTVLIERYAKLGGVCLNVGCIPSKALLHAAKVIDEARLFENFGISFNKPTVDNQRLLAWKDSIINRLTSGLKTLAKQRKVEVIMGLASFTGPNEIVVNQDGKLITINFQHAIIAVGSEAVALPFIPRDPRIFTATGGLQLSDIKGDLLVLGGGIIGLEMATVYSAFGIQVTVVEFMDQLIPGADADLVAVLHKKMQKKGVNFLLKTKVTAVETQSDKIIVTIENGDSGATNTITCQQMLVAVGRRPNGKTIAAEKAGVNVNDDGFIQVDRYMRTNQPHIYAIGDVAGMPMLAHKAIPEGRVAAENIAGCQHEFAPNCIPSVAYTEPEIAWAGLTEIEAKARNIEYDKAAFPWVASGRALSMGCGEEGLTKLLCCSKTKRILGAGIVGTNAGELISEVALAIEMECDIEDLALTIHPHPTLSETIMQTAEMLEGTITDLYLPSKKKVDAA